MSVAPRTRSLNIQLDLLCCLYYNNDNTPLQRGFAIDLVGYLRVSTDRQAEEGLGLDVQENACRQWARVNKHRLAVVSREEGVSGAKELEHRPALGEVLRMVRAGDVGGILVYRLDRLARDLVLQESLLAEIRRMGGQVFTTSAAEAGYLEDDPEDPSRRLIRQVLGAVNEYERSMISLRLRSGRRLKAEKGGYAFGSPPFGTQAKERELVRVPAEWTTVERIRELNASGSSLRQICQALEVEGRLTKRGGTRWHPTVVRAILERSKAAA